MTQRSSATLSQEPGLVNRLARARLSQASGLRPAVIDTVSIYLYQLTLRTTYFE
ncbi:hypothetical protein [Ktedonobacter racemifer]|uniref:hypothetical protein n=1 Tax=Ktedonobacter racemifer TaxID=363277 RepID=UPI0012FCA8D1|nr:hypothetical protein [Ktedonobacter racemifer]